MFFNFKYENIKCTNIHVSIIKIFYARGIRNISPFFTPPFGTGAVTIPPLTLTVNINPSFKSVGARTFILFLDCVNSGEELLLLAILFLAGLLIGTWMGNISPFVTPPKGCVLLSK
jgi:hypothetical protein